MMGERAMESPGRNGQGYVIDVVKRDILPETVRQLYQHKVKDRMTEGTIAKEVTVEVVIIIAGEAITGGMMIRERMTTAMIDNGMIVAEVMVVVVAEEETVDEDREKVTGMIIDLHKKM
jgi:hypothetical protein